MKDDHGTKRDAGFRTEEWGTCSKADVPYSARNVLVYDTYSLAIISFCLLMACTVEVLPTKTNNLIGFESVQNSEVKEVRARVRACVCMWRGNSSCGPRLPCYNGTCSKPKENKANIEIGQELKETGRPSFYLSLKNSFVSRFTCHEDNLL